MISVTKADGIAQWNDKQLKARRAKLIEGYRRGERNFEDAS